MLTIIAYTIGPTIIEIVNGLREIGNQQKLRKEKKCPKCDIHLDFEDSFCRKCGKRLGQES